MTRAGALFAAFALFFWMFLAADPLEQSGASNRFSPARGEIEALALSYAVRWRHGMAGNSPLFMPGFFAVAAAAWWWMETKRLSRMWIEGTAVAVSAFVAAMAFVMAADDPVIALFERQFALQHHGPVPRPSLWAGTLAAYTLATWTTCVIGCRQALARRAWRPLWPVPLMALGLVAIRTWTLDDVQSIWYERLLNGDTAAIASSLGIPIIMILMLRTELTSSRRRAAVPAPRESSDLRK